MKAVIFAGLHLHIYIMRNLVKYFWDFKLLIYVIYQIEIQNTGNKLVKRVLIPVNL